MKQNLKIFYKSIPNTTKLLYNSIV